jgi:hypothetical protein
MGSGKLLCERITQFDRFSFQGLVNDILLPIVVQHHPQIKQQISVRTAACWLHALGFNHTKGCLLMATSELTL